MEVNNNPSFKGIPSNAYRELKEGEEYTPVMSPNKVYPEANLRSVLLGMLMAVVFSASAAYLGLKVGQVFEAAIPISILAVGISTLSKRKNSLGENVIIQSIGACSGVIVAGAIFTLPALYILKLNADFYQVFLSSLLGGVLGILFLVPFRKYFVADMHGKYPFPEATATTEILVSGEKGGSQAKLLLISGLIGGIYDFLVSTFGAWNETFTTKVIPYGAELAEKAKIVFKLNIGAAVLGLGYIIGLKYAAIICAGSFIGWFVLTPLIAHIGDIIPVADGATNIISSLSADDIFKQYIRLIGIGGIAMAGIIGIIKSSGIIKSAFSLAIQEMKIKTEVKKGISDRTKKDLPMKIIMIGLGLTALILLMFFYFGVVNNIGHALIGLVLVLVIAFLFTTVSANAIAIVGANPVSGMTLMTLILTSLVLSWVGLKGEAGMVAALIIGGVVCTALAMSGGLITDLKIGYWLGSTPYTQQKWKFLGTLVSAATVGGVILVLNQAYGFGPDSELAAPQANAMAAVIQPLMSGAGAPWLLYASGAFLALILTMIGVPALPFALGMFIPLSLNTPLLAGGLIAYFVVKNSKNENILNKRKEKGTLIASGFIAGGALMGVVSAIIKYAGGDYINEAWTESNAAIWLGLVMFAIICSYLYFASRKVNENESEN